MYLCLTTLSSPHAMAKWRLVVDKKHLHDGAADMDYPNNDGKTPIMKTIRANKPGMFRALWLNGAGVDLIDLYGQSILHLAGIYSKLEIIWELQMTEIHVNPDLKDDQGRTAVDYFRERTIHRDTR